VAKFILWTLTAFAGYLTYTAAEMGGVDKVTVGFAVITVVLFAVATSVGKDKKSGKKAKAGAH
jgi:hypothetical protein